MLFNSIQYFVFLPVILLVYQLAGARFRWAWLLVASYYFYMSWNPSYALLILICTCVSYFAAIGIRLTERVALRKLILFAAVFVSLGMLFAFKYLDFGCEIANDLFAILGMSQKIELPGWVLPVGISFFTFQNLSYAIDVYRGQMEPQRHFGKYALYVAFFPQLVAGPIERSTRLLPQFDQLRSLTGTNLIVGIDRILIGLFKKLVVADRLAIWTDSVYGDFDSHGGATLVLATVFFAFQIYCDFSGYSDIAIGSARMLGIELMENFRRPYFARSIQEFWQRWHISLSTWFRDYLYIPLGGNRTSAARWGFNVLAVFVLSGIWHGANWTFVIWGFIHGLTLLCVQSLSKHSDVRIPQTLSIIGSFVVVCLAWVFFRADSVSAAFQILQSVFLADSTSTLKSAFNWQVAYGALAISLLYVCEFSKEFGLLDFDKIPLPIRHVVLIAATASLGVFDGGQFIYFQF